MTNVRPYEMMTRAVVGDGTREQRMQRVADVLWEGLHTAGVSWVGFYLDRPDAPDEARLELGPHRDGPACSPIGLHGVCGQSLRTGCTQIVEDTASLGEAYVACDPRDRSEIVIPLPDPPAPGGSAEVGIWGVLDLDSHQTGAFSATDEAGLREVLRAAGLI